MENNRKTFRARSFTLVNAQCCGENYLELYLDKFRLEKLDITFGLIVAIATSADLNFK